MAVTTSAAWTISSVQGPRKLGDEVDADQDARLNGGRVDFGAGVPPTGLGTALIWGQVGATSQRHLRRPRRGCTGATRGVRFIAASFRRAIPGGVAMVAPATIARRMRNERNDVVKPPRREWGSATRGRDNNAAFRDQRITGEADHEDARPMTYAGIHQLSVVGKTVPHSTSGNDPGQRLRPAPCTPKPNARSVTSYPDAWSPTSSDTDEQRGAARRAAWCEHTATAGAQRAAAYDVWRRAAHRGAERTPRSRRRRARAVAF